MNINEQGWGEGTVNKISGKNPSKTKPLVHMIKVRGLVLILLSLFLSTMVDLSNILQRVFIGSSPDFGNVLLDLNVKMTFKFLDQIY